MNEIQEQQAKQLTPAQNLERVLTSEKMLNKLQSILHAKLEMNAFISCAVKYIALNDKLLSCDRSSLYNAVFDAAKKGLLIDGKESFINVYRGVAALQAMYTGLAKAAGLKKYGAFVVKEGDIYEAFMSENGAEFKYSMSRKKRGALEIVVGWGIDDDGFKRIVEISADRAMQIRDREKRKAENIAKKYNKKASGPWFEHEDEMYKKHAIILMIKHMVDIDKDQEIQSISDSEQHQEPIDITEYKEESKKLTAAQAAIKNHTSTAGV